MIRLQTTSSCVGTMARVVNVEGKGATRSRQVRSEKTNESKPLKMDREVLNGVETRQCDWSGTKSRGCMHSCLGGVRSEGGVNSDQAAMRNVGTSYIDAKGDVRAGSPREDQSTKAVTRGGATRSSNETRENGRSEGVALFCCNRGSTGDGRSPWR
jgi:hypothetical protein